MTTEDHIIQESIASLGEINVPAALQSRIHDHQRHLMGLASSLLAGGHSRESVQRAIEVVMESFKHELTIAIAALVEKQNAQ
jgi:hypothetical protein